MATTLLRVVVGAAALVTVAYAQWDLTARLSVARTGHTATLLRDGRVLVAGGSPDRGATCINTAEVYDPATGLYVRTGAPCVACTYWYSLAPSSFFFRATDGRRRRRCVRRGASTRQR
jgi:hypothetical protein